MVAPIGHGIGGMLSQTNAFVREVRRQGLARLFVIDSAQRYRAYHDSRFWSRALGGSRQAYRIAATLLAYLRRIDADAVYIRSAGSIGLARDLILVLLCRMFRKRTYLSLHFGRIPTLACDHGLEWRLLVGICLLADGVEVLDQASKDVLAKRVPQCRVALLPNGIDTDHVAEVVAAPRERAKDARPLRIVFVGMVLPSKGVCELVEACAGMSDEKFDLELIGPVGPDMKHHLTVLAGSVAEASWLIFTGPKGHDDVLRRIADADILALPSYTEAFPMAVLEAMVCGLPVVATSVGALPEMLTGNGIESGLLVPPRDVESLRRALVLLLSDAQLRERLGSSGRERCRREYELSLVVRRWRETWCS